MANESNQSPKIPASGWLLVLFALGAFWVKDIPLQGSRPADQARRIDKYQATQDVDARLWQDPLAVIDQEDAAARSAAKAQSGEDIHSPCWIKNSLLGGVEKAKDSINEIVILAVLVPGGPYAESVETRRRARYAVVSGLRTKEFVPADADHLGFVRVEAVDNSIPELKCDRGIESVLASGDPNIAQNKNQYFTVPFEMFNSRYVATHQQVLLLWLNGEKFEKTPLSKIASLVSQIAPASIPECAPEPSAPGAERCLRLRVLGPRGSGNYRELIEELISYWDDDWQKFQPANNHVLGAIKAKLHFYSYTATIADERLFQTLKQTKFAESPRFRAGRHAAFSSVDEFLSLSEVKNHVEILRTIGQDDVLADALVREIELRGVTMKPAAATKAHAGAIALVSEWDSLFGRVLPSTLCSALMKRYAPAQRDNCARPNPPAGISYYSYLRGLDGKTAQDGPNETKDSTKKPSAKTDKDSTRADGTQIEQADGNGQFDYLRRMAASMKRNDDALRAQTGHGYLAIGVVGSDVYDKLIVLQALRPQFPEAIFFTTDLDARLLHPSENKWARNLVVASSFGLELDEDEQRFIPPFRDNYQTAAFLATKIALTPPGNLMSFNTRPSDVGKLLAAPRMFEVSSRRAIDLSPPLADGQCEGAAEVCLHAPVSTFNQPSAHSVRLTLALIAILLFCVTLNAILNRRRRKRLARLAGGCYVLTTVWRAKRTKRYLQAYRCAFRSLSMRRVRCLLLLGMFILCIALVACGPSMIATLFDWIADEGRGEPFYWFEGVSIWPTELIRLAAMTLAVYFIARGWNKLEENRRGIMHRFELKRTERAIELDLARWPMAQLRSDKPACHDHYLLRRWLRLKRYLITAFSSPRYHARPESDDPSHRRGRLPADAVAFWRKYVYLNRWHVRALRIAILLVVLFAINAIIMSIFGRPIAPVRGEVGRTLDQVILMSVVFCFQLLTIAALDATILCLRLITELRDRHTVWPEDARERMARKLRLKLSGPLGEAAARVIDEWLDIQIIAKRSEAVVRLIYYPMVVLSLMIVARNTAFDNWVLTPALMIVYVLNASLVVIAALALRSAAEKSRQHSLQIIRDSLSHYRMGGERGKPFVDHVERLAQQIAELNSGAFARFSQQPMVRSVLLLVGSVGGTSLLELSTLINF